MSDKTIFDETLHNMEKTVRLLSSYVESPRKIKWKDSHVYRYTEKNIHQALVQKSARLVSGLYSAQILSDAGFVQEQACIQRVIDELIEDISFLAYSVIFGSDDGLHKRYLENFYQEEFEVGAETVSSLRRPSVPRKKIRAYLERCLNGMNVSSKNLDSMRTLSSAYSGYIHAASPQIMDMYGGDQPQFMMRGMIGTLRQSEHRADLWNCYYRGIVAFCLMAKAFGNESLFLKIRNFESKFLALTGSEFYSNEWDQNF